MDISWLSGFTDAWQQRLGAGRPPHAVMLAGSRGTGKRAAAAWLAAVRSGVVRADTLPQYPASVPEHPDVYWLTKPEDKQGIAIDQVRALVADLALTSFEGSGKTAVIEPAQLMNAAAANALLKTLEEPAGDALLVLVVDRMGRLPATIVSRCQRIDFHAPAETAALDWLAELDPSTQWPALLKAAGGAPLEALRLRDRGDLFETLATDFAAVGARRLSPVEVAARWAKEDPYEVLEWLSRTLADLVRHKLGAAPRAMGHSIDQTVLERMDSQNLFCYQDIINRLRARPEGAFNPQTALESLLIDWAAGLKRVRKPVPDLSELYGRG